MEINQEENFMNVLEDLQKEILKEIKSTYKDYVICKRNNISEFKDDICEVIVDSFYNKRRKHNNCFVIHQKEEERIPMETKKPDPKNNHDLISINTTTTINNHNHEDHKIPKEENKKDQISMIENNDLNSNKKESKIQENDDIIFEELIESSHVPPHLLSPDRLCFICGKKMILTQKDNNKMPNWFCPNKCKNIHKKIVRHYYDDYLNPRPKEYYIVHVIPHIKHTLLKRFVIQWINER